MTREFVDQLSKVVQQLRDAATEERWSVDWERFEAMSQRAVEATTSGDFEESVRQHCRTIISVMSQLRRDDGK